MGNWKKKRGNIGPNKQGRYNRRTGKTENFNERNKRPEANLPKKADTETDEEPLSRDGSARRGQGRKGNCKRFIPEEQEEQEAKEFVKPKRLPNGPCCPDQPAIVAKNAQLLKELRRNPHREFDEITMRPDIIVIQPWFERKYRRHMPHFREYLLEQGIRTRVDVSLQDRGRALSRTRGGSGAPHLSRQARPRSGAGLGRTFSGASTQVYLGS